MLSEIIKWRLKPRTTRLPLYLVVFVTYRCNSHCRTCFYHEKLNTPESSDLPLGFYEKLAKSLDHLAWLHFSGGEPFLRKDLPELAHIFYRHTGVRRIGIPTNALLTSCIEESTERMLALCPDAQFNIVLSLDGLEKTHDNIRGIPGNWKKTMETLECLKKIRSSHPRLSLNICTVLNNLNAAEIPDLLRFVLTLGVNFHDVGLMRGDFPDKALALPPINVISKLLNLVDENARYYYANDPKYSRASAKLAANIHHYLNKTFLRFLSAGVSSQQCFTGDGFAVIEPNGNVKLCELTPAIGNLLDYDANFSLFWNSNAVKNSRHKVRCQENACTHSNFQARNFLLNPGQWWRALL